MKNQFKYFIVGQYIIRTDARIVKKHYGRFATYQEGNQALFDRAEKYGYIQVTL